jgi:hypothetical protein
MFAPLRVTGFVLLSFGFLWLCYDCSIQILRPHLRPVVGAHFAHLPKDDNATITAREARREIHDVAVDVADSEPFFLYPSLVTLVGGLVLAFAPRQHPKA